MSLSPKKYVIYYIINKADEWAPPIGIRHTTLPDNTIEEKEELKYYDYNSNSTISNIKVYFLSYFGKKYDCCYCMLSLYRKEKFFLGSDIYHLIDREEKVKLFLLGEDKLYILKTNYNCSCIYKNIKNFMYIEKLTIINKLVELVERKKIIEILLNKEKTEKEELKQELEKLKQELEKLKQSINLDSESISYNIEYILNKYKTKI